MAEITRRTFVNTAVKSAAAAGAGASALSGARPLQAESAARVVLGLVGAGGRGSSLIAGVTGLDNVETKYVCEVNQSRGGATIRSLEKIQVIGDPPHPRAVYCAGGNLAWGSQRETPEMQAVTYDFGDFTMTCENSTFSPYTSKTPGHIRMGDGFPSWSQNATRIEIYGTKQMMYVGRHGGGWQVMIGGGQLVAQEPGVHPDRWHQPNFIDCIRTRQQPNADVEQGHLSACLVHLGNLAYRAGNKQLIFDAASESFTNDDQANRLLKPDYREHFRIPDEV
jgi:hypothetical protein